MYGNRSHLLLDEVKISSDYTEQLPNITIGQLKMENMFFQMTENGNGHRKLIECLQKQLYHQVTTKDKKISGVRMKFVFIELCFIVSQNLSFHFSTFCNFKYSVYSPLDMVQSCNFGLDFLNIKTRDMEAKKAEVSQLFRCFIGT